MCQAVFTKSMRGIEFRFRALNLQFATFPIGKLIGPMKRMRFSVRRGDRPYVFPLDVAIDVQNASVFLLDVGIEIRFKYIRTLFLSQRLTEKHWHSERLSQRLTGKRRGLSPRLTVNLAMFAPIPLLHPFTAATSQSGPAVARSPSFVADSRWPPTRPPTLLRRDGDLEFWSLGSWSSGVLRHEAYSRFHWLASNSESKMGFHIYPFRREQLLALPVTSPTYLGHSMSCLWARKVTHESLKAHVAQRRGWHLLGSWPDERVAVPTGLPHRCTFVLRALNLQFAASSIEKLIGPMKLYAFFC